jgi:purine-binding chemotaxis protein CheW
MWYGISLPAVIEVLQMVALTELPETDPDVLGLLTLRDHIMPVIDLRVRFHQTSMQLSLRTPIVAVRGSHDTEMIGFVADEVDRVVTIGADVEIKPMNSAYITGAVQLEHYVLLMLDIPSFFESTSFKAIEA